MIKLFPVSNLHICKTTERVKQLVNKVYDEFERASSENKYLLRRKFMFKNPTIRLILQRFDWSFESA